MHRLSGENTTHSGCELRDVVAVATYVGFLSSWLYMNMEPLMKLGGRAELRVRRRSEV